jgi:hypothetical protein
LTKGGKWYFITFIDDSTRFCYVYLLKSKDKALHYFKTYKAEAENQLERKIKRLRSDRGGEYFSSDFSDFLRGTWYYSWEDTTILTTIQWGCWKKESYSNWFG